MSLYTVVFNDGKRSKKFTNSSLLSYYIKGDKFRSDVSDIILEIL